MTTVAVRKSPRVPRVIRIALFAVVSIVAYTVLLWLAIQFVEGFTPERAFPVAIQQTINALSIGAIYALIALGYTMVYGIIELINFAHGDVFMIGAFLAMRVKPVDTTEAAENI